MINNKKNQVKQGTCQAPFLVPPKTEVFRGKKGIIRILEAAIAVVMLIGFSFYAFSSQAQRPSMEESAYKIEHQILREIADNYTLRDKVLKGDLTEVNRTIESRIAEFGLAFSTATCRSEESCFAKYPGDKNIYADDIIISTNLSYYAPKKLAIFAWAK